MAEVALTRLDSRLAHGTVCNAWIPNLGVDGVIVIHDTYCNDDFIKKIFAKAIPPGVTINTISSDEAAKWWKESQFGEGRVMVLMGDVQTVYNTYKKGYDFKEVQIANISMVPGTKKVTVHKGVCMDKAEGDLLLELQNECGVKLYFQTFPPEVKRPLDDVIAKAKFKK